jgi:hypothetical protein
MKSGLAGFVASLALGGLVVTGAVNGTGCDDDDTTTGAAGNNGLGGIGGIGGLGGVGGAPAVITTYELALSGANEVPMVDTPAAGTVMITLASSNNVTVTGTFNGLSSAATVAHLHGPASATTTADPILDLTVSTDTSGIVTGSGQLTTSQATDMRNGMTYINIHSAMHMAGEIRAQVQ